MQIESSRDWRIFYLILGLVLVGVFGIGGVLATLLSGPSPALVAAFFPIGLGIVTILWLGRPAWIEVGTTEVSYVPPLGPAKVFPRSSIRWIVRIQGARGATHLEFRDQDNRKLVVIEQGFARDDVQKVAQLLNAKFTWDMDWRNASPEEMMAMMTPEERAEIEKHMKKSDRES